MTRWKSQRVGSRRIQAGLPLRAVRPQYERMNGLLMRGVVTATYEVDNTQHPVLTLDPNVTPVAVYCDVLCYTSMVNQRWQMLKQVLVSQPIGGMHRGRVWKPRAAKIDTTESEIDLDRATNPAFLDGDHVLVGFIDDNPNTPIILRGIPHPSGDVGNTDKPVGQRLNLKVADGDPDFWKHHGSYFGISDSGDFVVDTCLANDGSIDSKGNEPDAPEDGSVGNQIYRLPKGSKVTVEIDGDTLKLENADGDAILTLGDGAVHATIYEALEAFWNNTMLPKFVAFDAHVHANPSTYIAPLIPLPGPPVPVTPVTVPPAPPLGAPTLATNIKSSKTKIPDG